MPRCDCRSRCPCRHPAPQERQAMEDGHSRRSRPKRSPVHFKTPRPCSVTILLGPSLRAALLGSGWRGYHRRSRVETKPLRTFPLEILCRSVDASCQTTGPAAHDAVLRPTGRRTSGPHGSPERRHRTRHTRQASCGISLPREKGTSALRSFEQQSRTNS